MCLPCISLNPAYRWERELPNRCRYASSKKRTNTRRPALDPNGGLLSPLKKEGSSSRPRTDWRASQCGNLRKTEQPGEFTGSGASGRTNFFFLLWLYFLCYDRFFFFLDKFCIFTCTRYGKYLFKVCIPTPYLSSSLMKTDMAWQCVPVDLF